MLFERHEMKNLILLFSFLTLFSSAVFANDTSLESNGSVDFSCSSETGAALKQCRFDTDCTFGDKCKYGQCVDKDSCSSDYECTYGNICEFGRCKMAECRGGAYDCQAGQRCTNGRCEHDPYAKRCTTAKDCRTYERCSMGYCQ
jgi:hypothetical protein